MSTTSLPRRSRTAAASTLETRAWIQPLEPRLLMARPAGGGDSIPPGTVYYAHSEMVDFNNNQFPSFTGVYGMKGDGSGKTLVSTDFPGDPSRLLHGGRWMLDTSSVPGTYPSGVARREIFATPLGGGAAVQLTNNPDVQPSYEVFWSADDSFISFSAVSWSPVTSGGNYTDGAGNQWLADAEVFRTDLTWSIAPVAGTPAAVVDVGEKFNNWGSGIEVYPDVVELDWSRKEPTTGAMKLAYQRSVNTDTLHVASFDAALNLVGTVNLGAGRTPEFSPDASRIAYSAPSPDAPNLHAVWSVSPTGSGVVRLTKTAQMSDSNPGWSPDGKHIAFTRHSLPKGYQPGLADVMRMPATGGSPIDLTKDVEYAKVIGWRSDVQATTTLSSGGPMTTWSSGSMSPFSSEPVGDSSDSDRYRLIDLLAV